MSSLLIIMKNRERGFIMSLLITFFLGIFIMAGALIARSAKNKKLIEHLSISIALGTMSALAVLELFPEALEKLGKTHIIILIVCIALGIAVLKVLDNFIPDHEHGSGGKYTTGNVIHIGIISSIAIILHNIIEGMAVYSMSAESTSVGFLIGIGVGLHNIPMGMVIYSTLAREKRSRKTAFLLAASLSTFVGGIMMKLLWLFINDFIVGILISLTLGMIIYIVIFELLTHLIHTENKWLSAAGAVAGIAVILISGIFE